VQSNVWGITEEVYKPTKSRFGKCIPSLCTSLGQIKIRVQNARNIYETALSQTEWLFKQLRQESIGSQTKCASHQGIGQAVRIDCQSQKKQRITIIRHEMIDKMICILYLFFDLFEVWIKNIWLVSQKRTFLFVSGSDFVFVYLDLQKRTFLFVFIWMKDKTIFDLETYI